MGMNCYLHLSNKSLTKTLKGFWGSEPETDLHSDSLIGPGGACCPVLWIPMFKAEDIYSERMSLSDNEEDIIEAYGAKIDKETAVSRLIASLPHLNHIFSDNGKLDECVNYFISEIQSLNGSYVYLDLTEACSLHGHETHSSLFRNALAYFSDQTVVNLPNNIGKALLQKLCFRLKFEKDKGWQSYVPQLFNRDPPAVESFSLADITEANFSCLFGSDNANYNGDNVLLFEKRLNRLKSAEVGLANDSAAMATTAVNN